MSEFAKCLRTKDEAAGAEGECGAQALKNRAALTASFVMGGRNC
jgi:hypothetical protein